MASRAQRRFLERELPGLVAAGVVPPEVAERLRAHFAAAGSRPAVPLFAVLGAALIGLGVILLLAANWSDLSRPLRAALCLAMLLAAQATAGFALWRHPRSAAWGESTALGVALAAAAATALVAQTYQVQGDLRGFLTTWLLLCFPLPYLFDARGVAALLMLGAGGWLGLTIAANDPPHLFWLFVALLAPYLWRLRDRSDGPLRSAFLASVAVPVLAAGALLGFRVERADWIVLQAALIASGLYAVGAIERRTGAQRPFYATPSSSLAALAIVGSLLALGFHGAWGFVGETVDSWVEAGPLDRVGALAVSVGFGALAARGTWRTLRDGDWPRALACGSALVVLAGLALVHGAGSPRAAAALASLWTLAIAVGSALAGLSEADLRRANAGLLLLAALIFLRFADWNLSYTLRGIVFIGFGVGFLLLNLRLRRARRDAHGAAAEGAP